MKLIKNRKICGICAGFLITMILMGIVSLNEENIPSNIPTDVRSEIEGLYANATKRANAAFYLGEMGRRASPAIPNVG